ncbi:LOW QUALITY PROTEIN: leucine-rich repeat-containing protein 9 [Pluvialis apricaria]
MAATASGLDPPSQRTRDDAIDNQNQNLVEIITELYTCNALSYENIDQEGLKPTALEMFLSGYPRIVGMKFFPNIATVILIGQSIQNISHLGYSLLLKELWIAECSLVKIDGLQKCVNLQKLYLYCINSRIESQEALTKLNVLWLNSNLIKNIKCLHTLQNLQEVNLTGNILEKIGRIINSQLSRMLNVLQGIRFQFQFCQVHNYLHVVSQALDFQVEMKESFNLVVEFLLMELETVGNFHFEEGLSSNPWFSSCCYIIQPRFCTWDFRTYSIIGMKINHIFRVHNKIPRLKFKEKFQIFLRVCAYVRTVTRWICIHEEKFQVFLEMWASLERHCGCSHWHFQWFVFDHELVLPEYIGEFEYVTLLNLFHFKGSTLQDISRLKNTSKLIISFNEFTSLNNIYDLPNWEYFDVSHNYMITFEGIRGLSKMQFFNLSCSQVKKSREDINMLHKHTPKILNLDITHNPWHKASLLEYSRTGEEKTLLLSVFPCAKILSQICKNKVDLQMHPVELVLADQFRNVCSVNLQNNNLMSFNGLIFLPNAKVLCLNCNHIESILPGQKLPNQATETWLMFPNLVNAEFGENLSLIMQSLKVLHLAYNGITKMAQLLSRLKNLKFLVLQRNYISQIEGLEDLQFLQELVLDHNHIKTISQGFTARQNGLLTLHLEQNQIQGLNSLQPSVKLQKLFLDFNRFSIFESSALEKLQVIPSVKVLSKHRNPASIFVCIDK